MSTSDESTSPPANPKRPPRLGVFQIIIPAMYIDARLHAIGGAATWVSDGIMVLALIIVIPRVFFRNRAR